MEIGAVPLWVRGQTRSGKSRVLVNAIASWADRQTADQTVLVLTANNRNQRLLADWITAQIGDRLLVVSKTPVALMRGDLELFLPLVYGQLGMKPQLSLRLRPELEQKLARELWEPTFSEWDLTFNERFHNRLVRRLLDLLQLAGAAGIPPEEITPRLIQGKLSLLSGEGIYTQDDRLMELTQVAGELVLKWRDWCLERGFLTYGIIYELYWRYLLPNPVYQAYLQQKYTAVLADDVNDYPAIAKDLFDRLLDANMPGLLTENPVGNIRVGLNADPDYLAQLATRCKVIELTPQVGLGLSLGETIQTWLTQPSLNAQLPPQIQSIQTVSRAQLLQQAIAQIKFLVQQKQVQPQDIAIIAPGLDEVARYTLMETLAQVQIPVEPLNEQRPIQSSPWGRSLLTLLCLIYEGCGRLIQTSDVAEMLVLLSLREQAFVKGRVQESLLETSSKDRFVPLIDPVRAGLLVDYCFQPDPEQPQLLSAQTMARRDRLGYQVTATYEQIRAWIQAAKNRPHQTPESVQQTLYDAIQQFYLQKLQLRYEVLATLRELTETMQHFWEGDRRLANSDKTFNAKLRDLIQLIQQETITANPRPLTTFNHQPANAITLATIFQYRSARLHHQYQFWLDAGSRLWEKGGASTLFGYTLFQKQWDGQPWSMAAETTGDRQRLQQIVQDLLARTDTQLYLCHSDLSLNGTEQLGPLYPLIQSSEQITVNS